MKYHKPDGKPSWIRRRTCQGYLPAPSDLDQFDLYLSIQSGFMPDPVRGDTRKFSKSESWKQRSGHPIYRDCLKGIVWCPSAPCPRNSFGHARNNLTAVTGRVSYCPVFRSLSYPVEKDLLVELEMHPMSFLPGMQYSFEIWVWFFFSNFMCWQASDWETFLVVLSKNLYLGYCIWKD